MGESLEPSAGEPAKTHWARFKLNDEFPSSFDFCCSAWLFVIAKKGRGHPPDQMASSQEHKPSEGPLNLLAHVCGVDLHLQESDRLHGCSFAFSIGKGIKKVAEIGPESDGESFQAKVVSCSVHVARRAADGTVTERSGDFLIGDETGCVMLTATNHQMEMMEPGRSVALTNPRVNFCQLLHAMPGVAHPDLLKENRCKLGQMGIFA